MLEFLVALLIIILFFCLKNLSDTRKERDELKNKYSGIINIEQKENELEKEFQTKKVQLEKEFNTKQDSFKALKKEFDSLEKTKNELADEVEILEFGVYEPKFDFNDSEKFKQVIKQNIEKQKQLIKDKKAILLNGYFTIDGSSAKGKAFREKIQKLMMKAFNGESDSLIANANWSNVNKSEEKIIKACSDINKLGEKAQIEIQPEYLKLKREQLFLCYEYEETKKAEKERQKEIQQAIREEQKAIKEAELARIKAEKEAKDFQKALELAHEHLAKANEEEKAKYQAEIAQLQEKLKEAEDKAQRAISMAQQTKCGHIYIISNIGSFGENVYKIGMTRRLEPMERVDELGDASVPFKFDVHAMIYSENAPELENELHKIFDDKRVNKVNTRKEFFNVSLKEIEKAVKSNSMYQDIEFINFAEAREYRETQAIQKALSKV